MKLCTRFCIKSRLVGSHEYFPGLWFPGLGFSLLQISWGLSNSEPEPINLTLWPGPFKSHIFVFPPNSQLNCLQVPASVSHSKLELKDGQILYPENLELRTFGRGPGRDNCFSEAHCLVSGPWDPAERGGLPLAVTQGRFRKPFRVPALRLVSVKPGTSFLWL